MARFRLGKTNVLFILGLPGNLSSLYHKPRSKDSRYS